MDGQNNTELVLIQHGIAQSEDLRFLMGVALNLEQRIDKWHNRTARNLDLALSMNRLAEEQLATLSVATKPNSSRGPVKAHPVDPEQLAGAVLAHDIGMGFLPIELLTKNGSLNAKERKLMQAHIKSASELIRRMKHWEEARLMILAHHERVDGSGYPNKYHDEEICNGAKILAIVDAFTAQFTAEGRGNIMHGVMEIHRFSGRHFSEPWVDHFDTAIKVLSEKSNVTRMQTTS